MKVESAIGFPMTSRKTSFLGHYVVTMRPYLMFVSGITGIAGLSCATGPGAVTWTLIAVASFLSYGFGQALTDCFQTDTDALSSPYRPLVRGLISRQQVLIVSIVGLACCVAIFAWANLLNLGLGVLAGLGLATYTLFKRMWWSGPFYNAWIVVVLFLMGWFSGREQPAAPPSLSMLAAIAAVFFGYANFVLSGYFKDVEADRATGYNTLPVVCGRRRSAIVSDLFAAMGTIATLLFVFTTTSPHDLWNVPALMFAVCGGIALAVSQGRLHRVCCDDEAHRAIGLTVHGYILLLSSIAIANKPGLTPWLAVYYLLFVATLNMRPAENQI